MDNDFRNFLTFIDKSQCGRIEAETQPGGCRAIVKNMSQMCTASGTKYLGAVHTKAIVVSAEYIFLCHRLEETGPAGPLIEFRVRSKERQPATDTVIGAFAMII